MIQSRFTETQIVAILKEAEASLSVTEVCRKHGVSSATYYRWKAKHGGLDDFQLLGFGIPQAASSPSPSTLFFE